MKSKKIIFIIVLMAGILLVLSGVSLAAGEKYTIKENLLTKVELGTRAEQLLSNISVSSGKLYNGDKEIAATDKIATGMLLKDGSNKAYNIAVRGDASGDGKLTVVDLSTMKMHTLGLKELKSPYLEALDINYDGKVTAVDISQIKMMLVGMLSENNNSVNLELNDLLFFETQYDVNTGDRLIAVTKSGKEITIYSGNFDNYDYFGNKVYIVRPFNEEFFKYEILCISLNEGNGNYIPYKITEYEGNQVLNFAVGLNTLYFSRVNEGFWEYSLIDNTYAVFIEDVWNFDIIKDGSNTIISVSDIRITEMDPTKEKVEFINIAEAQETFWTNFLKYNNKIIYKVNTQRGTKIFEYDVYTKETKEIYSMMVSTVAMPQYSGELGVYIYKDEYIIFDYNKDEFKILSYKDGNIKELNKIPMLGNGYVIDIISEQEIYIELCTMPDEPTRPNNLPFHKAYMYNIKTNTFKEVSERNMADRDENMKYYE